MSTPADASPAAAAPSPAAWRLRAAIYGATAVVVGVLVWLYLGARTQQSLEQALNQASDLCRFDAWRPAEAKAREARALAPSDDPRPTLWIGVALAGRLTLDQRNARKTGAAGPSADDVRRRRADARAYLSDALDGLTAAGTAAVVPDPRAALLDLADYAALFRYPALAERACAWLLRSGESSEPLLIRGRARVHRGRAAGDAADEQAGIADLRRAAAVAADGEEATAVGRHAIALGAWGAVDAVAARIAALDAADPRAAYFRGCAAEHQRAHAAAIAAYGATLDGIAVRLRTQGALPLDVQQHWRALRGDTLGRRGRLRLAAGDARAARDDLREAHELVPQWVEIGHLAARAHLAVGDARAAERTLVVTWAYAAPSWRDALVGEFRAGAWDALPDGEFRDRLGGLARRGD